METDFDTASSGQYIVPPCIPFIPQGCTDINYVEYDPFAVVDDNSCQTLVQLGCIDETMFNYDSLANTMDVHPSCEYNLTITDGGADGWFGSWLGVTQGDSIYGPYQMGPNDGYEEEFNLNLTSTEEVKVYFFTIHLQKSEDGRTHPHRRYIFLYRGWSGTLPLATDE